MNQQLEKFADMDNEMLIQIGRLTRQISDYTDKQSIKDRSREILAAINNILVSRLEEQTEECPTCFEEHQHSFQSNIEPYCSTECHVNGYAPTYVQGRDETCPTCYKEHQYNHKTHVEPYCSSSCYQNRCAGNSSSYADRFCDGDLE